MFHLFLFGLDLTRVLQAAGTCTGRRTKVRSKPGEKIDPEGREGREQRYMLHVINRKIQLENALHPLFEAKVRVEDVIDL